MGLHWINNLPTSSGKSVAQAVPVASTTEHGIGFDLSDTGLEELLQDLVVARHGLHLSPSDEADVVVTDRSPEEAVAPRHGRVLRIGADSGRNTLAGTEPDMILAAASLLAAGYSLERERSDAAHPVMARLSRRERQVAELLIDGASNKVIARELDISVHTAKFHVTAILEKLGARNRADAVAIVLREGLVVA